MGRGLLTPEDFEKFNPQKEEDYFKMIEQYISQKSSVSQNNKSTANEYPHNLLSHHVSDLDRPELLRKRLQELQRFIQLHKICPLAEDFLEDKIKLTDKIYRPGITFELPDHIRELVKKEILVAEEEATFLVQNLEAKFGKFTIIRSGIRQYYTNKLRRLTESCWGLNIHGRHIRNIGIKTWEEVYDENPYLTIIEKMFLVRKMKCYARDAGNFWNLTMISTLSYLAMREFLKLVELQADSFDLSDPDFYV